MNLYVKNIIEHFDFNSIKNTNKVKKLADLNIQNILKTYIQRLLDRDLSLRDNEEFKKILATKIGIYKPADKYEIREIYLAGMDIYDFNDFCLYNIPNTAFGHNFPLSWIDTSDITDMSDMFLGNFPGTSTPVFWDAIFYGIEKWDVSKVTNMKNMFNGAEYFNRNLKNWDVSNVTDMSGMFAGVSKLFTGDGLENWDVSNVTDMSGMFNGCIHFNKGLSNWDVSNVTDMKQMFTGCHDFQGIGLQYWDVRKVENMLEMFYKCESLIKIYVDDWYPEKIINIPDEVDRLSALLNIFAKSIKGEWPKWYNDICL